MPTLLWIIIFGILMSLIALAGSLLLFLQPSVVDKMILPLVAFAAGSLIGGAVFHMIPHAVEEMGNETELYVWLSAGFVLFLGLEQFLNWHHSHTHSHSCGPLAGPHQHTPCPPGTHGSNAIQTSRSRTHADGLDCHVLEAAQEDKDTADDSGSLYDPECSIETDRENYGDHNASSSADEHNASSPADAPNASSTTHDSKVQPKKTLGYLILVADAVHNFLGGLFVGASFVDSTSLGLTAWTAAACHEVPQELGDFAILVHGGWSKSQALLCNFVSALTFPLGGIISYMASKSTDISFLIPFAAGNFLYIGATDLIPEIKHYHGIQTNALHFSCFVLGLVILLIIRIAINGW